MNYDDSEEPIFNRNLVVPTLLFGILSPGLLLTLPAESRGFWLSGQTSTRAIVAHTIVFGAVLALVRSLWPSKKTTSK
ncbi:uncharacterized protein ACA1_272620 [Acanthamoeba castellanii str. Neff]|uniref:Transmembrane protein n=1 Tax=Acanthamoeba castellanii (strain ATCC 30010 / Neff) TaxID=1257118 RepID=L8HFE5_ACACF|nr:uncharacterized protein ACA1_272620 [Acanthamoeba castellanii str. Neff]ELR24239.1 hypothetical protein ACA1_272620 [Acanthamoeba castellanii str. Neff]